MEDVDQAKQTIFERQIYDLVLLDFGNVGKAFGGDEGLSLLKYIKRVCPSAVVLTYTSKALPTAHADFYRLADGTLSKDAGIGESTEKIEEGLRRAWSVDRMWAGFLDSCNIKPGSEGDSESPRPACEADREPEKETRLYRSGRQACRKCRGSEILRAALCQAWGSDGQGEGRGLMPIPRSLLTLSPLPIVHLGEINVPTDGWQVATPAACKKHFRKNDACRNHYDAMRLVRPGRAGAVSMGVRVDAGRARCLPLVLTGIIPYRDSAARPSSKWRAPRQQAFDRPA